MPLSKEDLDAALKTGKDTTGLSDEEKAKLRGDETDGIIDEKDKGKGLTAEDLKTDEDDGEKKDDKKTEKPEPRVPQSRVNEIVARARARSERLESEVAELRTKLEQGEDLDFEEVETELDKLENQYIKLAQEKGKEGDAAALRKQIRTVERRVNNLQALYLARGQSDDAVNRARTDEVVNELEATYAFLDPKDKENFDPDVTAEILRFQKGFIASGIPPHQAMLDAAAYVISRLELVAAGEEEGEGESADKGEEGLRSKQELAGKQPPDLGKAGKAGIPQGVTADQLSKMGAHRFEKIRPKLSEDELKRARGDFL